MMIRTTAVSGRVLKKVAGGALLFAAAILLAAPARADETSQARGSAGGPLSPFRSAATAPVIPGATGAAADAPPPRVLIIRRGEPVVLAFSAPGLQLTTRTKALEDAALGEPVRLINIQSNKVVDGIVTGPAAAVASTPSVIVAGQARANPS